MRRMFTVAATVAALAVPASVATLGIAPIGPAGAVSAISCSGLTLTGTLASGTIHISKCLPSGGAGYASATGSTAALITPMSKLTWSSSHATTTVTITATSPGKGVCTSPYVEYDASGTVNAASTTGPGIPKVGDAISGKVCIYVAGNKMKLAPNTKFKL